eukprot:TRINITY_DN11044_c0_g1_i2.p1 TRINITY_DN11044_c0_g1~~TRINITY_DN11044_c0_g1_i2.p1  ORF type:complete len:292 (-),score=53.92 TRINITY_DN11044_c0_g1_i2:591-1466(-)
MARRPRSRSTSDSRDRGSNSSSTRASSSSHRSRSRDRKRRHGRRPRSPSMSTVGEDGVRRNDNGGSFGNSFTDKQIRLAFIRKVYAILCSQLVITICIVAVFTLPSVKRFSSQNTWLFYVALSISFIALISLACCPDVRRKTPYNYIFLCIYTLTQGFTLGCATATFDVDEILIAVAVTAAIVLALTLLAFQTTFDFTAWGGVLLAILICFTLFGFIALLLPQTRTLKLVYAGLGVVIFSLYLILDTQLMLGGTHKYALSPEDYVFAALNLYIDIIQLFINILKIVKYSDS